jgi:acyl carrier protein
MIDRELKEKIFSAVKKHSGVDCSEIDPDKALRQQMKFDSLQFVGIIAHLERELGIEMPISVMAVNTINEFVQLLRSRLAETRLD